MQYEAPAQSWLPDALVLPLRRGRLRAYATMQDPAPGSTWPTGQTQAPVYVPMQTPAPIVEKKIETPTLNKKNEIPAKPKTDDKKNNDA